jgi:hypothetical protein
MTVSRHSPPPRLPTRHVISMSDEVPLSDGWPSVGGSVLLDGQLHRTTGPWTAKIHALLDHLETVVFDGAPRVVGFDCDGRGILSWIDGRRRAGLDADGRCTGRTRSIAA